MDRQAVFEELNLNQRSRVADRERAEHDSVQHLEDRGIGSDAERQRKDGRDRQSHDQRNN